MWYTKPQPGEDPPEDGRPGGGAPPPSHTQRSGRWEPKKQQPGKQVGNQALEATWKNAKEKGVASCAILHRRAIRMTTNKRPLDLATQSSPQTWSGEPLSKMTAKVEDWRAGARESRARGGSLMTRKPAVPEMTQAMWPGGDILGQCPEYTTGVRFSTEGLPSNQTSNGSCRKEVRMPLNFYLVFYSVHNIRYYTVLNINDKHTQEVTQKF